jgi:hypothetical protein
MDDPGSLDEPAGRLVRVEIGHPVAQTTLGGVAFLQVLHALVVERLRPREHGYLDSARAEVAEELAVAVPGCPHAREIGLAIRGLRRRG